MTMNAPPIPGPGGGNGTNTPPISPPITPMLGLTSLWVWITLDAPTNFFLDVFNTISGDRYGVTAKGVIDPDPFNTWSLVSAFDATASTQRLSGVISAPMRFYGAVNLSAYAGPRVQIVSPGSGSTVSGDVPVEVAVNDILPLHSIEVFVGEVLAATVQPGQHGRITVPSYWFPNGSQEIWVRVVNDGVLVDTDGNGVPDSPSALQSWTSVPVTFENEVYMTSFSSLYSSFGSITMDYVATTPHDYTFEVSRLTGELLNTQSGASSGGNINPQWNFTDLSGQPVNDSGYVFSLTATPQGGVAAAAGPTTIRTTNFFDKGVTVGRYVISYGEWPRQDLNDWMAMMNDAVSARANTASFFDESIIGPNREAHGTIRVDFSSEPYAIKRNTQTNDLAALTNALADPLTGSWLWEGHAGYRYIIPGDDRHLTVGLDATDLAAILGNRFDPYFPTNLVYTRRLHATINTGCSTVNGLWPIATGTPPGVRQEGNPWIKKSAFVGFTGLSQAGETKSRWTVNIHNYWIDGSDYDTLLKTAVDWANLDYPDVVPWGPTVIGYRFIHYNGQGSR